MTIVNLETLPPDEESKRKLSWGDTEVFYGTMGIGFLAILQQYSCLYYYWIYQGISSCFHVLVQTSLRFGFCEATSAPFRFLFREKFLGQFPILLYGCMIFSADTRSCPAVTLTTKAAVCSLVPYNHLLWKYESTFLLLILLSLPQKAIIFLLKV